MATFIKRSKQTHDVVINEQRTKIAGSVDSGKLLMFWYFIKFPCGGWVEFDIRYFGIDQNEWMEKASHDLSINLSSVAQIIKGVDAFSVIREYMQSSESKTPTPTPAQAASITG